jgi:hypothetical protein
VIETSGPKEDTNRQIDAIFDQLVEIVQPSAPATPPPAPLEPSESSEPSEPPDLETESNE